MPRKKKNELIQNDNECQIKNNTVLSDARPNIYEIILQAKNLENQTNINGVCYLDAWDIIDASEQATEINKEPESFSILWDENINPNVLGNIKPVCIKVLDC